MPLLDSRRPCSPTTSVMGTDAIQELIAPHRWHLPT